MKKAYISPMAQATVMAAPQLLTMSDGIAISKDEVGDNFELATKQDKFTDFSWE